MRARRTGAEIVCETLERLGVRHVFGLPGTQNVDLFGALAHSRLRAVAGTTELAAAFMANGYARSSGELGVLVTIPGPGFAFALPGLAEARLDSAPLLHVAGAPATEPGSAFQLQAIEQAAVAAPLVKRVLSVREPGELADALAAGAAAAVSGEPGPVLVQVPGELLSAPARSPGAAGLNPSEPPRPAPELVARVAQRLGPGTRALLFCGQGAAGAAAQVLRLAELLPAPVATTTSGRGAIPEDHPLCVPVDLPGSDAAVLNALVASTDVVLALGCKLSHNGTVGFQLRLDPDRLVHVDASPDVLGANYPASIRVEADTAAFLDALLPALGDRGTGPPAWRDGEIETWRRRAARQPSSLAEPRLPGTAGEDAAGFFAALRAALPAPGCLVTDSGLHQYLARRYFPVLAPRTLIPPSDFQAMGFGIPAAIGARLARDGRPVVALVGDGGLAASGLELLTAVREGIPLTVVVFSDGYLGLIRLHQLRRLGRSHAVELRPPALRGFAESVGASYAKVEGDPGPTLRDAVASPGVTVVEVALEDAPALRGVRAQGVARAAARSALGPGAAAALERRLRRRR